MHQTSQEKNWLLKWHCGADGNKLMLLDESKQHRPLRTWYGRLAEVLLKHLDAEMSEQQLSAQPLLFNKSDVQRLLMRITVAYHHILYCLNIKQDLCQCHLAANHLNTHVLLQVRLSDQHLNVDDLSRILQEEGMDDISKLDSCLRLLKQKNLIQVIATPDGQVFIDKNPTPHAHVYIRHKQLLLDVCELEKYCQSEALSEELLLCEHCQ